MLKIVILFFIICEVQNCIPFTYQELQLKNEQHHSPNLKDDENNMAEYRLPNSTRPIDQLIRLQPIIGGNYSILGYTEITFEVLQSTNNITLNIVDITGFDDVTVSPTDDPTASVPVSSIVTDTQKEFFICLLEEELSSGTNYTLFMRFEGRLNEDLKGFYRSSYVDANNNTREFAVSQFAPNWARYAFPCYDEPAMKASFRVQIIRQDAMHAVSNMPIKSSEPLEDQPGWVLDTFFPTVPMSSYLVAFLVSDLVNDTSFENDHVVFRAWTRIAAVDLASYALEIGPPMLSKYENYFGIPYPLPKLDMAAVPDFYYGAMENWGLIIYRESRFLYDPTISSALDRQKVCLIVAHEMAHQWFGNLVTMEWWDQVWLNEGFAVFFEAPFCDGVEPDFFTKGQFNINELQVAFDIDSLETAHPITNPVTSPEQIGHIYDSFAYAKGGSVLRMAYSFLLSDTFQRGISNYIGNMSYSNANQYDLWYYLNEQAHVDGTLEPEISLREIMDTWTLQAGYPLLYVQRFDNGTALLTQQRYFQRSTSDHQTYTWWIPVTYTTEETPDFSQSKVEVWMTSQEETKVLTGFPSKDKWAIFNLQQDAYYRVNYDIENWHALTNQLHINNSVFNKLNRVQMLDDGFNFAKTGRLPYEIILNLSLYLGQEVDYSALKTAFNHLEYINYMFLKAPGFAELKEYMTSILVPLYEQVGFEDNLEDPHLEQLKRSLILPWSCRMGSEPCLQNSVSLFAQWMLDTTDESVILPNIRKTVYCSGIAEGSDTEWDVAYSQYLSAYMESEKQNLLHGLGCSQVAWILERYLEMAFDEQSGIRKEDIGRVFTSVSSHILGNQMAWDFLRQNFEEIANYGGSSLISDLTSTISKYFNTELQLNELEAFDESLGTTVNLTQSIERTENNIQWMETYYDVILTWLQDSINGV